ncbi:5-carboxymethyl-2-hydroxymuconate isomerase [Bordetella petrii]|nr:5-carboxymethyl-2-hydroxymuconate isomerase [Bordetella petrii]
MKFVSYQASHDAGGAVDYGVVADSRICRLTTVQSPTLREALSVEGLDALTQRARAALDSDGGTAPSVVRLLSPIPDPGKVLCVGLNYFLHAEEAGMAVPERPSIFVRFGSSFTGHEQPVLRPKVSEQFDYEAELAVVIGRRAYQVDEKRAMDYVAGYTCMAENSIRDWQRHSNQATPGKNFMSSGALGPYLVTADEAGPVEQMRIVGRLNGEQMQNDLGKNMIFTVPQIIAYLSTFTELVPGDIIATGTPAGVGFTRKPPRYLRPGDVFEVDISRVGVLRNSVAQAT